MEATKSADCPPFVQTFKGPIQLPKPADFGTKKQFQPFFGRSPADRSSIRTGKESAMKLHMLPMAALAATLATGAFAQTAPTQSETGPAPAEQPQVDPMVTNSLENTDLMQPFFTDDTMTTMRPMEEMRSAWTAMSDENRTTMLRDCEGNQSIKYREFCGAIQGM
jgi:hypothetical protein